MNRYIKTALLAGAAWSALSTLAVAQDAPPRDPAVGLEDVIVTARRTEEAAQRTPLSISAFSGEALERQGTRDVTDLQGAVPNLNIVQGRGSSNATNIYIRGVGQPDALQTFDPAVGVYVDDVYFSRIRGTQFDLLDLQRVEVLRGPQGTLYGKNTIGGALKLVSRTPDMGPYLNVAGTIGDYSEQTLRLSGAAPLTDTIAVGGAFISSTRDGYVTDPVTGAEYNDKDTLGFRLAAAITPSDTFRLDLAGDFSRDDAGLTVGRALAPLFRTDLLLGSATVLQPAPAAGSEYNFQTRTTPGLPNSTELEHAGLSATATWTLSDALTLKSITAYRDLSYTDYIDIDATQFELGDVLVGVDQDQLSQEFQLAYDDGGPITAVGGVYYLKENIVSHQEAYGDDIFALAGAPVGFTRFIDDDLETESWAVYGNVSWRVTEALRLSGGIRYTEESKDYDRTTTTDWTIPSLLGGPFAGFDALFNPFRADPTFAFTVSDTWEDVSPMASIDYQISPDAMLYARVSKGFKSGGFNGRANNPGEQQPYDPETVLSYEIGAKTSWMDNRLRANVAAFHNKYEDFQARVSDCVPNPAVPGGACVIALTVLNAGELDISGVELELEARPIPALTLDAQIGYLDAAYGEFEETRVVGGAQVVYDRSGQEPAFSPDWTARLGAAYAFELGESGRVTVGAQSRYRSDMALAVDNADIVTGAEFPEMFQDSYWLYDARVVWESADGRYTAGVYGRNLSDEVYKTDAQEFSSVAGIRSAYYGAPRTVSLTLTARY
ncbi:MAG: TonB-dependent receptor [Pseudomonadota bacterium]|nr:TonB-dependent receptor [Pseudomonadota bacterium]